MYGRMATTIGTYPWSSLEYRINLDIEYAYKVASGMRHIATESSRLES